MQDNQIQDLRLKYLPSEIKVLFIGESPPKGRTFFYLGRSILLKAMKDVIEEFYNINFSNSLDFLDFFKESGYFLDDLCHEPINYIKNRVLKERIKIENIRGLAYRLKDYNPQRIITIMMDPHFNMCVDQAINHAGIDIGIKYDPLPFPRYNRNVVRYKRGLEKYLRDLQTLSIVMV